MKVIVSSFFLFVLLFTAESYAQCLDISGSFTSEPSYGQGGVFYQVMTYKQNGCDSISTDLIYFNRATHKIYWDLGPRVDYASVNQPDLCEPPQALCKLFVADSSKITIQSSFTVDLSPGFHCHVNRIELDMPDVNTLRQTYFIDDTGPDGQTCSRVNRLSGSFFRFTFPSNSVPSKP